MAHIEVNIDYPEHDVEELTNAYIKDKCANAILDLDRLLLSAEQGKILREGIVTAIVGRPNVGKSSLLNALAQDNKAIVTDIPGTTRDVIEEYVNLNGIPLKLLDTAGLRETEDIVERIGVERSRNALTDADLILLVINRNEPLHEDEKLLMEQVKDKQSIVVLNKSDLPTAADLSYMEARFPPERIVPMSVKENEGLDRLGEAIANLFFGGQLETNDITYVSNVRHIHLLNNAKRALEEAQNAADQFVPIDMIQIDIRNAWENLGELVGDSVGESLIDQIFSQFCLGK
jgi:tRNA modification GTPase